MSQHQDTPKQKSPEELKIAENIKALTKQNSALFTKSIQRSEKSTSWSFRSLLFCCEPPEQEEEQSPRFVSKKTASTTATNHYSKPSSFLNNSKSGIIPKVLINTNTSFYPTETLFLLGRGTKKIMSKIIRTSLVKQPSNKNSQLKTSNASTEQLDPNAHKCTLADFGEIIIANGETYNFTRQEIFSLYSKGVQIDKSDWSEITPECVAEHVASSLRRKFVIDALSGYGGNVIQFAKHCPQVIGVEIDCHKIKKAEHNARIYNVHNMIDFINADYFTLKNLRADVVFLAPSELPLENKEKFSILKHLSPNLPQLVRHSLNVAESLCILLPASTNIEEIASLFCDIFDENPE